MNFAIVGQIKEYSILIWMYSRCKYSCRFRCRSWCIYTVGVNVIIGVDIYVDKCIYMYCMYIGVDETVNRDLDIQI